MTAFKFTKTTKRNGVKLFSMTSMSALLTGCLSFLDDPVAIDYYGTDGDDIMEELEDGFDYPYFHSSLGADTITAIGHSVVDYSKSNAGIKLYFDGTPGEGGHAEGDILTNIDEVIGSEYADYIVGAIDDSARIYGRGGDDELYAGGKGGSLSGGAGNDKLYGKAASDTLSGGIGIDELYGEAGNDSLSGGDGNDKLYGGDGDDQLRGGAGADILEGGLGVDILDYWSYSYVNGEVVSPVGVTINLTTNAASGGDAEGDVYTSIEGINGSGANDHLTGDAGDNRIQGNSGDDEIYGLDGNDYLRGDDGDDLISGGDGNDIIHGGNGKDKISGGSGNDIIYSGKGYDELDGGAGDDVFYNNRTYSSYDKSEDVNDLKGGDGVDTLILSKTDSSYDSELHEYVKSDFEIKYTIQKANHNILLSHNDDTYVLNSVETISLLANYSGPDVSEDIKQIWSDLAAEEQGKFVDEAEFLSWLGDDAGYNYEGL